MAKQFIQNITFEPFSGENAGSSETVSIVEAVDERIGIDELHEALHGYCSEAAVFAYLQNGDYAYPVEHSFLKESYEHFKKECK